MEKIYLESLNLKAYESLDMAIFIKNIKSQYLWANHFFVNNSGIGSSSEIIKKTDDAFAWRDFADDLRANDKILFETTNSLNVKERILRYQGTYVDIATKKIPLFDNTQKLIGLIGFSLEIPSSPMMRLLSRREYETVLLISEGYTTKQIAKKWKISPRTVESHVDNAKNKLGVKNRAQLLAKMFHP